MLPPVQVGQRFTCLLLPINVNNHTTYALLDSGSTNTFMSQSLASRLRFAGGRGELSHEYVVSLW